MVDVAVSTQLQQWAFEKSTLVRPAHSDSSASSPDMYHNDSETLRIDTPAVDTRSQDPDSKETLSLHERYLSSEEDLSPMEGNSDSELDDDDDMVINEVKKEYFRARKMSVSRFEKGKSCDLAVVVSFTTAGRPKMIDLANQGSPPLHQPSQRPQRSASLEQLPIAAINKLLKVEKASRLSLAASPTTSSSTTRSPSPAISVQSRRPSLAPTVSSRKDSTLQSSDSSFTESSTRSSSPWAREKITRSFTSNSTLNNSTLSSSPWTSSRRPVSAAVQPTRPFIYTTSAAPTRSLFKHSAPLTPLSPAPHAFLSFDPFETPSVPSALPPMKSSSPHKRLRSISQKLSLAKIAITPSTKKRDSRLNGKSANSPSMPLTPNTPITPQTAPPTSFSTTNKLRRHSSRPNSSMGLSTPEMPPIPSSMLNPEPRTPLKRLIPRGANERQPMIELPPFPVPYDEDDPAMSLNARRLRKRKSLMDLL